MKKIALIILLGIVGVAVLGFVAMTERHGNGTLCLSDIVAPAGCPDGPTFSQAFFHSSVYKSFSAAVLLAFFLLFFISWFAAISSKSSLTDSLMAVSEQFETQEPFARKQINKWFEIHEKRDPAQDV